MPSTAALLTRHAPETGRPAAPARRRRHRTEPHPTAAAAALQRSLDRRDNGGETGHC
ncbi:hypothetical protein ACIGXM_06255 [Kitasatospora sp. NPDC052896]|uniref:hypothetical protein n=1 Tax=Kitasatospora sp. NPDC052896 TaxID=3364061 RepID=UPI0037C81C16